MGKAIDDYVVLGGFSAAKDVINGTWLDHKRRHGRYFGQRGES